MKEIGNELILALDFGTTNIKGAVYDISGDEIAFDSIEYSLICTSNSIIENDLNKYWDKILLILKNLSKSLGDKVQNVVAIGTSSQGETIVPIDKYGKPLRNAITWLDTRTTDEVLEIKKNFNIEEMYKKSGCPDVDTSWPATKVLWIRKNEPEIFMNTYMFLLLEDYCIYKLTGKFIGESSVYSSSYYYDIFKSEYIDPMLSFLDIKTNNLPEVVKPGTMIGNISKEICRFTGLPKTIKVVIGAMDQISGTLGAGNTNIGIVTETTGSCFAMVITTFKPNLNSTNKLPCIPHALPDLYALMPYNSSGGIILKWFKDVFCNEEQVLAKKRKKSVFKVMDEMASKISAGSDGLIMLPFLTGALFPEYNSKARAVFFNISINHSKAHFIRAVMEAIAYMMEDYLESIQKLGINMEKVISIGGGASSMLWSQIKADVSNIVIEIPEYTETALLGSAILAARALGFYKNISEAIENIVKIKSRFFPNRSKEKIYKESYEKYKLLYRNVNPLF